MPSDHIDPEFYTLHTRAEGVLASIRLERASEPINLNAVAQLHDELTEMLNKMTTMVTAVPR